MADDKKRYIGAGLGDEAYYALIRMSTFQGRHPTSLIEEYVSRGLAQDVEMFAAEAHEIPADLQVFRSLQAVKAQANTYMMLKQIASALLTSPDERLAEQLHTLCDCSAVSFEGLMKEVQTSSLNVRSAISFDDDKSLAHTKAFLMDVFKSEMELRANDVYDMADKRGFTKASVREAKQELGIMSLRRSKGWVWVMPSFLSIPSSVEVSHGK